MSFVTNTIRCLLPLFLIGVAVAETPLPERLRLPGKKGLALVLHDERRPRNLERMRLLNGSWNYTWTFKIAEGQPEDVEFIPMFHGRKLHLRKKQEGPRWRLWAGGSTSTFARRLPAAA